MSLIQNYHNGQTASLGPGNTRQCQKDFRSQPGIVCAPSSALGGQNPDTQILTTENFPVILIQSISVDTEVNIFLDYQQNAAPHSFTSLFTHINNTQDLVKV